MRFGTSYGGGSADAEAFIRQAKEAERFGFSTFCLGDHIVFPLSPIVALHSALMSTSTLRVATSMLAQDLRHPAVLAKDIATMDVFSGGRVELGIGAGWMRDDYERTGIPMDSALVRIERLEEYAKVLRGLFGDEPVTFHGSHYQIDGLDGLPKPIQRPSPPIMMGGSGRKLLELAARTADVVHIFPYEAITQPRRGAAMVGERVDWIRDAAGDRIGDLEVALSVNVLIVDDRAVGADKLLDHMAPRFKYFPTVADARSEDLLSSPCYAIGSEEQVCEQLLSLREKYGVSYFMASSPDGPEGVAPIVARLNGE